MERNGTQRRRTVKRVRVSADLEPSLIAKIDQERRGGMCSRATIIRMALLDRYRTAKKAGRCRNG